MTKQENVAVLFELGGVEHGAAWPDYVALGISAQDIPALLTLIADDALHSAAVDSAEVWVPMHAWRCIAQLGQANAAPGLLAVLEQGALVDDDWAREELPTVLSMLGADAVTDYAAFVHNSAHSETARMIVVEGLVILAVGQPELRDRCVNVLMTYLLSSDSKAPALNGLVVCGLLDLRAVEALNVIQDLYENGRVDISYAGDWAQVQASFAKLDKAPENIAPEQFDAPQHPSIFDEIDTALARYGHANSVQNSSELDGFFAALACAPASIEPEQWLPMMFGGEGGVPQWASQDDEHHFVSAALVLFRQVTRALKTDTYAPYFLLDENGRATVANDWCQGFLRGVNTWPVMSRLDTAYLMRHLKPFRSFVPTARSTKNIRLSEEQLNAALDEIEANLRHLYENWRAQREDQSAELVPQKLGRNDPCHCGSGKKFKKCCLH